MSIQKTLPFDHHPIPPERGGARARQKINEARELCQWFRAKQAALKVLLADDRLTTGAQLLQKAPKP